MCSATERATLRPYSLTNPAPRPDSAARSAANHGSERGDALAQLTLGTASRRVVIVLSDKPVGRVLLADNAFRRVVRVAVALGVAEPSGAGIAAVAQRRGYRAGSSSADIRLRRVDGRNDGVRLGRKRQMDRCLSKVDPGLGQPDERDRLRGCRCGEQGGRVGQPDVLAGVHDEAPRDEARIFAGLDHPGQVVQGGVDIRSTNRLDECADHVIVLVTVAVVPDRSHIDGLLECGQVDVVLAGRESTPGRGLERVQRPSGVTARTCARGEIWHPHRG